MRSRQWWSSPARLHQLQIVHNPILLASPNSARFVLPQLRRKVGGFLGGGWLFL